MKIDSTIFDELKVFLKEKSKTDNANLTVISAYRLSENEKKDLSSIFDKLGNASAKIDFQVDGEIMAGIIIRSGSTVIDLSLNGQLLNLKQELYENT